MGRIRTFFQRFQLEYLQKSGRGFRPVSIAHVRQGEHGGTPQG